MKKLKKGDIVRVECTKGYEGDALCGVIPEGEKKYYKVESSIDWPWTGDDGLETGQYVTLARKRQRVSLPMGVDWSNIYVLKGDRQVFNYSVSLEFTHLLLEDTKESRLLFAIDNAKCWISKTFMKIFRVIL